MHTFQQFRTLLPEAKLEQLSLHAISLDLAYDTHGAEAVLFAYGDFYVELVVEKITDDILAINCFKNANKLVPYLHQVDISEIVDILSCSK
jgi:hypothetical protein